MDLKENYLYKQDDPLMKILSQIIEELRYKEVIVRDGGFQVEIRNIEGKGRDEINISEIPYYLDSLELSKDLSSQINDWCVQKTQSGEYIIKF